jgi:hypothetical protein
MTGGPVAPKGTNCPLYRKDVSKVCHTCEWYTRIQGVHPQTGEHLDKWLCAMKAQVLAVLDVGKAATAGAATTQELRNDMQHERRQQTRLLATQLLPNNNGPLLLADAIPVVKNHGVMNGENDERNG